MLREYLLGVTIHQEFINLVNISEADLFAIDKTKIKRSFYFKHVDFGNDDDSLLSIKSFGIISFLIFQKKDNSLKLK